MNDEFVKAPIYQKWVWAVEKNDGYYYLNDDSAQELLSFFRDGKTKFKTYCVMCQADESFTSNSHLDYLSNYGTYWHKIKNGNYLFIGEYKDKNLYLDEDNLGKSYLRTEILTCNLDESHQYIIYYEVFFDENEFVITKIGQNISPYEIGLPEVKKYEKILDEFDIKEDYRKVFIHRIHGDYIAALLYLRRVFEKMINKLIDDSTDSRTLMDVKIKNLKKDNKINPDIEELTSSVYALMSKGIHELNNEECNELFKSLNEFVEMQLIFVKTEKEKKKKYSEIRREVNKNHQKHKK